MLTHNAETRKETARHKQEQPKNPAFIALMAVVVTFLVTGFSFAFGNPSTPLPNASQELIDARQENAEKVSRSLERGALVNPPISVPEDAKYTPFAKVDAKVIPPKNKTSAISDFIAERERQEAEEAAAREAAEAERALQETQESQSSEPAPNKAPQSSAPQPQSPHVPASTSQEIAHSMVMNRGWGEGEFSCLVNLWQRESNWNHLAQNPSSGAYGIPQSLPGNKMASHGSDWQTNPATQIAWGIDYIAGRYGTPCGAWQHSENHNWY